MGANSPSPHMNRRSVLKLGSSLPVLAASQLYDGNDLQVTTDYRRALSEILLHRLGNPNIADVFPGYTGYSPMNIVSWSAPIPGLEKQAFLPMNLR